MIYWLNLKLFVPQSFFRINTTGFDSDCLSFRGNSHSHTHFSDKVDVTFPLLDIWRTFRRNSVGRMRFSALRRIKNRRREAHFQHVIPIRQQVSDREVLKHQK